MQELLDLLLPTRCVVCGESGDALCRGCRSRLPLLTAPVCGRCGSPAAAACLECDGRDLAFATARSAVAYRGDGARTLAAWKEGGVWRLTRIAASIVTDVVPRPTVDALTSVPPDRDRVLWRGHDPAAALGRALGREWGIPYRRALRRASRVAAQKRLDGLERQQNVAGSFAAMRCTPECVAVVDDVYTTGATASAAAQALCVGGAQTVEVVTFARTLRVRQGRSVPRHPQLESHR
ncbi:MAG: ComF family protein [Gaiellaceae bacterium]